MKTKNKILIIIFAFLICISIFNNSFGAISLEYNSKIIVLKDINIETQSYLITYNESTKMIELIVAPEKSSIYFDKDTNYFFCADSTYKRINFNYYYCIIDENNCGGNWSTQTTRNSLKYENKTVVKKNCNIYPCFKYRELYINKLPEGISWQDNICIFYSDGSTHMVVARGAGIWITLANNGTMLRYRTNYQSKEDILLDKYKYENNKWTYVGTATETKGNQGELFYFAEDIIKTNGTLYAKGYRDFFFQLQPQEITIITEVKQIPQMIMTMIKQILPIGLIIFGMLLTILLVRLVILRMI